MPGPKLRFHTTHLLGLVVLAAFTLALFRHPEALWAAVVPCIGGVFVVLPVLGLVELFADTDSSTPNVSWGGGCLVCLVGAIGIVLAIAFLAAVLA
jgi:drug/metabolite transporter superfamily protein YnfA